MLAIIRWRIFCLPVGDPKKLKIKIYRTILLPVVFVWVWNLVTYIEGGTQTGVFENRVLRRIFGPKMDEVTGEWRKLHNEELNDLYCLPYIFRVIKSRKMIWAGHVTRMGGRGEAYTGFWCGNLRERNHLGDRGVDGRIILKWIFR